MHSKLPARLAQASLSKNATTQASNFFLYSDVSVSNNAAMKLFSPYWWYWTLRPGKDSETKFSNYVIRRYALTAKRIDGKQLSFSIAKPDPLEDVISAEKALDWLYGLLGILDTKASAL